MLEKIRSTLGGYCKGSNQVQVKCPCHADKSPSLTVTMADGKILFYCHAGCTQDQVYNALHSRGLMPEKTTRKTSSINKYLQGGKTRAA